MFLFFKVLAIQTAEQFEALGVGMGVKCAVVSFWPKLVLNRHYKLFDYICGTHFIFGLHDCKFSLISQVIISFILVIKEVYMMCSLKLQRKRFTNEKKKNLSILQLNL